MYSGISAACFLCMFTARSHQNNGLSIQTSNKQLRSGWHSKQMLSGIGYSIHVPARATPRLFNTSCNSQRSGPAAARGSDLAAVLSGLSAYYRFGKLRIKQCMKCMWIWSSSLPVTPQSSKINWLASQLFPWRCNPQTVGSSGSLFSTLSFQSFMSPTISYPLFTFTYREICWFWAVQLKRSSSFVGSMMLFKCHQFCYFWKYNWHHRGYQTSIIAAFLSGYI